MQPKLLSPEQRNQYMDAVYSCLTFNNSPYLAPILVRLKPLSLPGLETLASDEKGHVFIDFDFLEKENVSLEDFGRLVQHEAWHVINKHENLSREVKENHDDLKINIAMDLEINQHIPHIEEGWTGKTVCLPGLGSFKRIREHLTWRQYLEYLPDLPQLQMPGGSGVSKDESGDGEHKSSSSRKKASGDDKEQSSSSNPQSGSSSEQSPSSNDKEQTGDSNGAFGDEENQSGDSNGASGDDKEQSGSKKQQSQGSNYKSGGDQQKSCGRSQLTQEILDTAQKLDPGFEKDSIEQQAAIRDVAIRIKDYAKSNPAWGAAHKDTIGWADKHLAPSVVHWKIRLSRVLGTKIGDSRPRFNYTWRKPSRRHSYGVGKPYYPAFRGDKTFEPNIVIGIDVSGSMSMGKTLNHVAGEIDAILRSHMVKSAYAFFVDVETEELQEADRDAEIVRSGDTSLVKFSKVKSIFRYLYSGGGTDMRKALIAASELKGKFRPDIFILVTDCGTPWLEEKPEGLERVETIILAVNTSFSATTSSAEVCRDYHIPEWLNKGVIPVPAKK